VVEVAVRYRDRALESREVGMAREDRGHWLSAIQGIEYRGTSMLGSPTPRRLSRYRTFAKAV
jgi:hypothetical protein